MTDPNTTDPRTLSTASLPAQWTDEIGEKPGDTVGPYHLLERIGEGGFGAVYLAEQRTPIQRRVAVKFIKPGLDTRAVIARFEAERQTLALMDHPYIAKVFDAGATQTGRPYFVMENVPGSAITEYCDRLRLTIKDRLELFAKACEAVAHAHTKGVIHRDLKPSNILVSEIGGEDVPRVIDFGVAKATQRLAAEHSLFTERGVMIGTPEYMSPEQAESAANDIDTRTDIYALGVILYELLTGELPFDPKELRRAGYAEIRRIIREVEPPRPSTRLTRSGPQGLRAAESRRVRLEELTRALRGELEWIPLKAMRKDRRERYRTATELADDVRNYLHGRALIAAPESHWYRARKSFRRYRTAWITGGAVVAALAAGLGAATYSLGEANRSRRESEVITTFLSEMLGSVSPEEAGRDVPMRIVLDNASTRIASRLEGLPMAEARLRRTMGNAYRALGEIDQGGEHLALALDILRERRGEGHAETLRAIGDLAGVRHEQGRFTEAEALSREALAAWRGKPDDLVPLGIRANLAMVLDRTGRSSEALAMQREAVEGMRRTLGAAHEHTLGTTINLASMLKRTGDTAQCERMLKRAREDWTAAKGPEHPGAILAATELAGFYLELHQDEQAEGVYREILDVQRRVEGPRHPSTARAESSLAVLLNRTGRTPEALGLAEQSWAALKDALGEVHPDTLAAAVNLMEIYTAAGWPQGSQDQLAGVIASLRSAASQANVGDEMLNTCAWMLLTVEPESMRDTRAALAIAQRCVEQARSGGNASLWSYLDTLALARALVGDAPGALAAQREAVALLPASMEMYRGEMEGRLREYEAAVR